MMNDFRVAAEYASERARFCFYHLPRFDSLHIIVSFTFP